MQKSYEEVEDSIEKFADQCVKEATSFMHLRFICRQYRKQCIEVGIEQIKKNPVLMEELLERTLLLYHICLSIVYRDTELAEKLKAGDIEVLKQAKEKVEREQRKIISPFSKIAQN
jgi:hypothetical protein